MNAAVPVADMPLVSPDPRVVRTVFSAIFAEYSGTDYKPSTINSREHRP